MRESSARLIVEAFKEANIDTILCVPESLLKPLYSMLYEDPYFNFIYVTNEGEGAAIAAGAWLGGKKSILIMENSGLRVASEALARLGLSYQIPVLMMMCHRGDIGEPNWWGIAHNLTMEPILNAMNIPYKIVAHESDIKKVIKRCTMHIATSLYHVAIIMSGDTMEGYSYEKI